jgi:hypothetical protein
LYTAESEAQKLSDLLQTLGGAGDISTRILSLPPSLQTQFEADFWGFLDAVEDARDVTKSALQLRWYQLPGRYQHSHQLRSIRERLQKFVDQGFSDRLEQQKERLFKQRVRLLKPQQQATGSKATAT